MKIYSFVTLLLLGAAWLAVLSPFTAGAGPVPKVGNTAPLIQGQDQNGKNWKLADDEIGKVGKVLENAGEAIQGATSALGTAAK